MPFVRRLIWLLALSTFAANAANSLERQIAAIAATAKGQVSVACSLPGSSAVRCDFRAAERSPMQSVFKLPLAVTVLRLVERGQFRLDQPVRFLASDRILPVTFSPLQTQYPEGGVDIPLRELLRSAVEGSDNVAADILLRLIGGPKVVTRDMHSLGIAGFRLQDNEAELHRNPDKQFRNWFRARDAVKLLNRMPTVLQKTHLDLIRQWMRDTPRGTKRLRGDLPAETVVLHKPGTSSKVHNDFGYAILPDGRELSMAVFLSNPDVPESNRDQVIAQIARVIYDAAIKAK